MNRTAPAAAYGEPEPASNQDSGARRRDVGLYTTAVAAELTGLPPHTLRLYERRGLLEPARTDGGKRRYSPADLDRLRHIAELTSDGVNLQGVRRILELEAQLAAIHQQLEQLQRDAVSTIRRVQTLYRAALAPAQAARGEPEPQQRAPVVPLRRHDPVSPGCHGQGQR